MNPDHVNRLLQQGLADLAEARRHLHYSFQQAAGLPDTLHGATEKQLESTEAFTGRFARAVDLLVNKVLRSLDRVELRAEGTLLDVVNRDGDQDDEDLFFGTNNGQIVLEFAHAGAGDP